MHDPAADRAAIEAVRNRVFAAMNSGVTDSVMAVYADDILLMPNNGAAVSGSSAVRAWFDASFSQVSMTARDTSFAVDVFGDLAVDHFLGELTVTFKAPGVEPIVEGMKGINVYRREADGTWKVTKAIWNEDPPVPTSAGAGGPP